MRRICIAILTILLLTLFPAITAHAASFISIGADPKIGDPHLHVFFKEAGLGNTGTINYNAASDATAEYACLNGSGKVPGNKETVKGPVNRMAAVPIQKNGSITVPQSAPLTINPPEPGNFSCPGGLKLTLASVSYTHLVLTDTTNGIQDTTLYSVTYTFTCQPGTVCPPPQ
jgi:hypothetical protein